MFEKISTRKKIFKFETDKTLNFFKFDKLQIGR